MPYASSCLTISEELLTWRQAEDVCFSQGAHLLSIDREHKDFSRYLFRNYKLEKLFIGLIGTPAPHGVYTYRWSDGSPFVYSNWNNLNFHCKTELCVAVIPRWSAASAFHYRMSWSVVSCLSRNRFICEKPRSGFSYCFRSFMKRTFVFVVDRVKTDVRLVDGVTPNRGRLEVFVDGEWSRVCIGPNRMRTAFAVCRHLNYQSPLFVRALNRSVEEIRKNFSHMVDCSWNEALSCTYDRATCEVEIFLSCQSALTRSIGVRLVRGKWSRNGLLEVSTDGSWKKVCGLDKRVLSKLPQATCRHLGFDRGGMRFIPASNRWGDSKTFYGVCMSNSIKKCSFKRFFNRCFDYIWIECYRSKWQVRLMETVHNVQETEGTIEVFVFDKWKFVCEDKWNINAAQVVCSELGYEKAISAKRNSELTSSNRKFSPLKVLCHGRETALRRCTHFESKTSRPCNAAGLVCKEKECKESNLFPFSINLQYTYL